MKTIKIMSIVLLTIIAQNLMAQNSKIIIGLRNLNVLDNIAINGDHVIPTFTDDDITQVFANYTVYSMEQTYPASRFIHMHRYYTIECNSSTILSDLIALNNSNLPFVVEAPIAIPTYTPSDYGTNCNGNASDLDLIRAKQAWDITKGDPNIVMGVTDRGIDTAHNDYAGKLDTVRSVSIGTSWGYHGTIVSSIMGAKTDNNIGISSIGFNCKLDISGNPSDNEMLTISNYGRRVLNASWLNGCYSGSYTGQGVYNEIYENGTIACFGAGNGYAHCKFDKAFPASYDHNMSISSVGSIVPTGQKSWWPGLTDSIYWNQIDVHENVVGATDTMSDNTIQKTEVHNHNEKVDLVAPGYTVTSLANNQGVICEGAYGTSFASPLVAGTCGLMLSTKPCLTPYQMEWILKNTAKNIYNIPENVQYIGQLGAGRLDAGAAVSMASQYDCNSLFTQTMNIKGVELNTICIPGLASNSVNPQLFPIIENGTAPFTYTWEADPIDNDATLDATNIANPTVLSSTAPHRLHYRLTVYDNSQVQKVASKNIQIDLITTARYDVAMRDSYMDMLDEPNTMATLDPRESNNWLSPDIWNRQQQDGDETPQNAEYFNTDSNYMYVRVRNVGCIPTPANMKVRMYWTKSSTGEVWKDDWTVTNYTNPQTSSTFPAGREVTQTPIDLPILQPGDNVILNRGWRPVKPENYDTTSNAVDVCLLVRIEEVPTSPFGMTFAEPIPSPVNPNVTNNNNIVTRNLSVVNFNPLNKRNVRHILVGNTDVDMAHSFDFQLINERSINPHFSGDLSQLLSVEVRLGELFDRWVESGMEGTYFEANETNKSVIFNGSETMLLRNITLEPNERLGVTLAFNYKDGSQSEIPHMVHFRQLTRTDEPEIYGNVSFRIDNTVNADGTSNKRTIEKTIDNVIYDNQFAIYPNPTTNKLNIQYLSNVNDFVSIKLYDLNGRIISEKPMKEISQSQIETFDVSQFTSGVYLIEIRNDKGEPKHYKFIKK